VLDGDPLKDIKLLQKAPSKREPFRFYVQRR